MLCKKCCSWPGVIYLLQKIKIFHVKYWWPQQTARAQINQKEVSAAALSLQLSCHKCYKIYHPIQPDGAWGERMTETAHKFVACVIQKKLKHRLRCGTVHILCSFAMLLFSAHPFGCSDMAEIMSTSSSCPSSSRPASPRTIPWTHCTTAPPLHHRISPLPDLGSVAVQPKLGHLCVSLIFPWA